MPVAVAVTGGRSLATGGAPARATLNEAYLRAVEQAGLVPLVVLPSMAGASIEAILGRSKGLLLTGGGDINPRCYGEPIAGTKESTISDERDEMELQALKVADSLELPVLAICRGMQLLNVARGGSLQQHIDCHSQTNNGTPRSTLTHDVVLERGSRLAEIVGALRVGTNSMHHQVVSRLGEGLAVTGRANNWNGPVEAIEEPGERYIVGVQWHPEELLETSGHAGRLFASFARACGVIG